MAFYTTIRSRRYQAATLRELSEAYCKVRDESGEGGSTFRSVNVFAKGGKIVGHISYNGRVWDNERATIAQGNLLYDNRVAA